MPATIAFSAGTHKCVRGARSGTFLSPWRRRLGKLTLKNSVFIVFILLGALLRGETQTIPAQARITAPVDEAALTRLAGNTHPLARPEFDQGAVADSQPLRRVFLLLKRRPDQESALRTLMDEQQSKSSPNYHRWLTPEQFGRQFGPADADVRTVTGWLQSHELQVARVSAGKTV